MVNASTIRSPDAIAYGHGRWGRHRCTAGAVGLLICVRRVSYLDTNMCFMRLTFHLRGCCARLASYYHPPHVAFGTAV
eukprot:7299118-Prymnesium_polylepis.1